MATAAEPTCNFCRKHGLLIMPVRYAIAPIDMGLPAVTAPLKVEDAARCVGKGKKQDLTLHGSARYTTRLLRSGYLYVYDEKRDWMAAYWITQDGYYMSFPPEAVISEQARSARPCSFAGHQELAGCIAIPDAAEAGMVWLGYSDVQWTPAVIKAHKGSAGKSLRELHMRAFDAGAWAKAHQTLPGQAAANSRGSTPHVVGIDVLATTVADYAAAGRSAPVGSNAFMPPSAPHFRARAGQADGTLSACRRRSPGMQSAIVALDDPAGVAQDLAALINSHQERLLDTHVPKDKYGAGYGNYPTTYRHLFALDGAIKSFRKSNDEKVKLQVFQNANEFADYMKLSYAVAREDAAAIAVTPAMANRTVMPGTFVAEVDPAELARQQALDTLIRNPSPQNIQAAQDASWNEYLKRIRSTPYSGWADEFRNASDTQQAQHIEPLAMAHAAWMQSNLLSNKLDCTHDGQDALSGDVYAETFQRCIAATQEITGCAAVYLQWLNGEVTDRSNLLLRALLLRQDDLISAMAATPLDPANVPWAKLMAQYTSHVGALLKPGPDAHVTARAAQQAADKAQAATDAARRDLAIAAAFGSGESLLESNASRRDLDAADARAKEAQAQAEEAMRNTRTKLLPDSVASVLVQVTGLTSQALREFNDKAAEKALARWMAIVGVTLKTPAGVVEVSGQATDTIEFLSKTFVDHLKSAGEQNGKPLSMEQVRQLTRYAKRQVAGSFASGNIRSFETMSASTKVTAKLAVFITDDMNEALAKVSDPTRKVAWLVEHVKTPRNLHDYGVLRVGRAPMYGAVSEGVLTAIDAACKYAGWQQMLSAEAKALTFQKTWAQDVRNTLGGALYVGALATGVGNVVKAYGTWRNLYATGMAKRAAGDLLAKRAEIALRVAGAVTAAVSGLVAAMDIVDASESWRRKQWGLMWLQGISGLTGIAAGGLAFWAAVATEGGATVVGILSLTGWVLVLAIVLVALGMAIDKVKGDNFAQWLERCYWGTLASGRYTNPATEQADFNQAMAGA